MGANHPGIPGYLYIMNKATESIKEGGKVRFRYNESRYGSTRYGSIFRRWDGQVMEVVYVCNSEVTLRTPDGNGIIDVHKDDVSPA